MNTNLDLKYYIIDKFNRDEGSFTIIKSGEKNKGGAVAFLKQLKHHAAKGRGLINGIHLQQDETIHEIAKKVYEGYENKMGAFCRFIDLIKRKFGFGNRDRKEIQEVFDAIMQLPAKKYQPLVATIRSKKETEMPKKPEEVSERSGIDLKNPKKERVRRSLTLKGLTLPKAFSFIHLPKSQT